MPNTDDPHRKPPHIALFPNAGMGHLTPFLRLSSMLAARGCTVTLIIVKPILSAAESTNMDSFFFSHPQVNRLELEMPTYNPSSSATVDPFVLRYDAISRSDHFLGPLLSSFSPPISALLTDFTLAICTTPIADHLQIPNYVVVTTSARFSSLVAYLPSFMSESTANFNKSNDDVVLIPGLSPLPLSTIPPIFFNPNHIFTKLLTSNAPLFTKAKGILLNTFEYFESETITAMKNGRLISNLPPVFPIGPFPNYRSEKGNYPSWLDDQEDGSVVYVSFGSRTALSNDQIRELGDGLERSGYPFLWVLKTSIVDKEDKGELQELLGEPFLGKTEDRGIIVQGWVEQEEILSHPAIGAFISHCGWNSVTESTRNGVPILAWPLHGDQRVNAEVVEKAGLGIWVREWGWAGERVIRGEEIGEKIKEMMSDDKLKKEAKKIGEVAKAAFEINGSSEKALMALIHMVKKTEIA